MPKKPTRPSVNSPSPANSSATSPTGSRRRTANVTAEASDRSPVTGTAATTSEEILAQAGASLSAQPTYDEIASAAYQRFLSRGGSDGRDFEDWIEAERELRERSR